VAASLAVPGAGAQVVFNEIHFNPPKKQPLEFIELHNAGDQPVTLTGWRLIGGIDFKFPEGATLPPKGYLVVVQDAVAFEKAFGTKPLGQFEGKLGNDGDRLELRPAAQGTGDKVKYGAGFPWPTAARGAGASIELIHPKLDRDLGGNWRSSSSKPTPGAQNSVFAENAPPAIRQVDHSPSQPAAKETVVVTAKVTDPDGVASAKLEYQLVEPGNYIRRDDEAFTQGWIEVAMRDDGQEGDESSGDAVYSARLPGDVQVHRRLVRYRIHASDKAGAAIRVPYADDDCPNFAYRTYDGAPGWTGASEPGKTPVITFPETLMKTLPVYHLIAAAKDVERSQWDGNFGKKRFRGTLVVGKDVYDHIEFRNRGQASTHVSGKNKWAFEMCRAREFQARDPWRKKYDERWNGLNLSGCASPWAPVNRGMAGLDEAISFRTYELAGVPSPRTHPVHFRVIDSAEEASPTNQYDGDQWGLYLAVEEPDGAFLDTRGLPDGSTYSHEGGLKHLGAGQPADGSDWKEFTEASRRTQPEAWWRANLDLPAYYSFHACNRLTGNVDLREGANHFFYHGPDGRWVPIPWDLDMQFIPKTHQSGQIDQARCLTIPALRIEYKNRCRELLDLLCADATPNGGQIGQLIDEYARFICPPGHQRTWADLDECVWNHHPRSNARGAFYRNPARGTWFGGDWERKLVTPNFAGFVRHVTDFMTNSRPGGGWKRNDGDPRGHGYGWLQADAEDADVPLRPRIGYSGPEGFPVNALRFHSTLFADPQGPDTFAAVQWRIARIAAPGLAGYTVGKPRRYEVQETWSSPDAARAGIQMQIPLAAVSPGQTYRVRARMKDTSGRWSRWSEPVQFVAGIAAKLARSGG